MKKISMCVLICSLLMTSSCRKETPLPATPPEAGAVSDTTTHGSAIALYITDSSWTRTASNTWVSDLTAQLHSLGVNASEIYAIQVIDEALLKQIFPCCVVDYKGGEVIAGVSGQGKDASCGLLFEYTEGDYHFGEVVNKLPFFGLQLKVTIRK